MDTERMLVQISRAEESNKAIRAALDAAREALTEANQHLEGAETTIRDLRLLVQAMQREAVPPSLRRKIIRRDRMVCQYCGGRGDETNGPDGQPWHIDHVVPKHNGGLTHSANLALACAKCNEQKGGRSSAEYIRSVRSQFMPDELSPTTEPRPTLLMRSRRPAPRGEGSRLRDRYTPAQLYDAYVAAGGHKTNACLALFKYSDPVTLRLMNEAIALAEQAAAPCPVLPDAPAIDNLKESVA